MWWVAALLCSASGSTDLAVVARVVGPEREAAVTDADVEATAVVAAAWFYDVALVPRGRLRTRIAEELRRCGSDRGCASARLSPSGVDRALFIITNLGVTPGVTTLELLDVGERRLIATAIVDAGADPRAGIAGAVRRVLLDGGHRLGAQLVVTTSPPGAPAIVTPGPYAVAGEIVLLPGTYRLTVEADGYRTATRDLVLDAGARTNVDVELEPSTTILTSPWLWVGVAAVVAGAATTAVLLNRPDARLCHPRPCSTPP